MAERVSRKELATKWGTSTQYVDKLVKDGRLKVGDDRKIDLDEAIVLRASMNPNSVAKEEEAKAIGGQRREQQGDQHPMVRARLAREVLGVKHKELVLKKLTGELVAQSEVKGALFEAGRAVQASIRTWPSRLSGEIAALQGLPAGEFHKAVRGILDREVARIVSDLIQALESIAANDKKAA